MKMAHYYQRGFATWVLPLLMLCTFALHAQQTTYRINYDISLFDLPGGLVQASSGNVVFAGTNTSFIPISGTLTEVNNIGTVVWSKRYNSLSVATDFQDIKRVASGGYIITGSNGSDLMLMRTDAAGNVTWANTYQVANTSSFGNRVLPTSDGGFVVAGSITGADPDGAGALVRQDSTNMYCIKVNSSGTLQWGNVFFYTTAFVDDHSLVDVAEVSDGYIFTGSVNESGNDGPTDAVVIKTNTSGARQWSYRYGGGNSQDGSSIRALSGSEVLISGGDNGRPYYIRMSSAGSVTAGSRYSFGFLSFDQAFGTDIVQTNDGNYAMFGTYIGFNVPPVFSAFILKINPSNGSLIFQKYYSPTSTSFLSISLLPEGIQAADSSYMMISTGFGSGGSGGYDYELIKADKNGLLNNTGCPEANLNLSRASFTPGLSSFTPITTTAVSASALTMVITTPSTTSAVACRTIICNRPEAANSVTATNNNFCPGGSSQINASGTSSNVVYKVYTASTGGTLLGTTPLTVSPIITTTYYVETEDTANPGCVSATRPSVTITVLPAAPLQPGTISGPSPACPGSQTYTIGAVTNASSYTWSVSGGGTISGSGTSASVNWTTPGTYTVSVTATNSCGTSPVRTLSVTVSNPQPAQPGAITGNTNPCPGTESYTIAAVTNATSYTWSVSGGGTITGSGTSASVSWTTSGGPYTISVTATNSCGTSAAQTLQVNVQAGPPTTIGAITGLTNVCVGSQPYSVPVVPGATTYTWSVSSGGSITGGQGTRNATINWTSAGTYNVSITASNGCGSVNATPITVTVAGAPPITPGPITGTNTACTGNQTYTIPPVAGADSYTWSISGGGSVVSGANSTSFTVNWTTSGTHTVSVTATNACGTSSAATTSVTVSQSVPSVPGAITGLASVCAGSQLYSIATVAGATGYTWAVSNGGSITSGQGTNSIAVNWATPGGPYTVTVVATNICGSSSSSDLQVTVLPANPAAPASITGNTPVCFGSETYTAAAVAGASGYTWSVSGGGTIATNGNQTVSINWTTAGTWTVSVTAQNQCGSSSATTYSVSVLPASPPTPGNITGPLGVCPGSVTYSIPTIPGATGYTWTVGAAGTITSGQGTESIDVTWASASGTYTVSVTAENQCGSSTASSVQVNLTPGAPTGTPTISGNDLPCPGPQTYTVGGVTGASDYTWTVSGGGTIQTGQGTGTIIINWTTTGGPYTIEVTPSNACGNGTSNTFDVTVDGPPVLGAATVTGNNNPCPSTENYSISSVSNATGYTWTLSGGGTITSGQGTAAVAVNWTTSGGPYTLSVNATNACGSSALAATYNVTVQPGPPATPGAIAGTNSVCQNTNGVAYTIASVTNATNYTWSISGGGTIVSGQGTTNATIDWTGTPGNYTVSVTATNSCGTSTASTLNVTITPGAPAQPGSITGVASVCPGAEPYNIGAVTNATGYTWTLSGGGTIATGQGSNSITVNWTTSGGPYQVIVIATNACGNSTAQTVDVTVNASPTAPSIITSGDTICEGESATITATGSTGGAITYNIFSAQTGGSSLGVSPLTVSPIVTTTYYVEVINDLGCRYSGGRVPVTIVVAPAPAAPVVTGSNGGVCYNESATLTATSSNSTITWWNAATGGTLLGSGNTLNTGALTNTTTFYAEATNANGCGSLTGRVAVTVNVAQLPTATLTSDAPDNSIFINQALIVTVEPSDYTRYEFFLNGTSVQLDSINTWGSSAFNDGDVVSVIVTDGGCVGNEVELTVRVTDLPNAFTPNGDGRNDDFLKGFELVIINRWGQELYNGFDGWDGYYNGERVSPGTYFYIVRVPDITDTDKVLKGSVLVHY